MLEQFFSVKYAGRQDLFEGLEIWENEKYRNLQGTYPVINFSFANIKERQFDAARKKICQILSDMYSQNGFLLKEGILDSKEIRFFESVSVDMDDVTATLAVHQLSSYLYRYYGKKVIILLDEYDTPMQEAYVNGYWDELTGFIRNLFNSTFKTNPYLERAVMTGITRVSRESIFSDLNNLKVITTTSDEYADCFGFTEEEVFAALKEFDLADKQLSVKKWYDGFTFGTKTDIYNPWSIINYLDTGKLRTYWANTSSNSLIGKMVREGSRDIKQSFERLMAGEHLTVPVDEQIVYDMLDADESAIWSFLLASGYLKMLRVEEYEDIAFGTDALTCDLAITNLEVKLMFGGMIHGWFARRMSDYNEFIKALIMDDLKAMNVYMNKVALGTFSYFDTGNKPSASEPERFYHGFVLGLMVELNDRYTITSNRESGFGRYDVMLEPKRPEDDAMILEFKVQDAEDEKELTDTVKAALEQIDKKSMRRI